MSDQRPSTLMMVDLVDAALETVSPAARHSATARLAAMYAEAIDDNDEGDGLFRFGPGLRTSLETLGLALVARGLQLPRPMIGRLQPSERQRQVSTLRRSFLEALAA
jgi:hypothetical protein